MSEREQSGAAAPWYGAGLHFECTRCGRCCTGAPGYVWVDEGEIAALAAFLGLSLDDFGRKYLRKVGVRHALLERADSGDCVLYDGGLCTAYDARPRQCRAFPFWPRHLVSPAAWAALARECEGIRDDAPLVAGETISELAAERARGADCES